MNRLEHLTGSIAISWLLWEQTNNPLWFNSYSRSLRLLNKEKKTW